MAGKPRQLRPQKIKDIRPQNVILRERAERCRKLADAIGDLEFAVRLHALAVEYDRRAKQQNPGAAGGNHHDRVHWRWATLVKDECLTS
jgi:hypothetical protein